METLEYSGEELDLFQAADNWKSYWSSRVSRFLLGDVLEVGAGTGNNTSLLYGLSSGTSWTCLEPDPRLASTLTERIGDQDIRVVGGTTAGMGDSGPYDTVLYIDVLEHIEDDRGEVQRATELLRPNGHLVVLSPAHQFLYTPFDKSIGHFRRYSLGGLEALTPPGCKLVTARYMDSVGMFASLANRLFMRQSLPTLGQVRLWDRMMVPVSRLVDPLMFGRVGKSVLVVWQKS